MRTTNRSSRLPATATALRACPARPREHGTALVMALLFLMLISMLGMSSMTTTTLEEKMSGNSRDQNLALQAAEAALRDAETDLTNLSNTGSARLVQAAAASCAGVNNCFTFTAACTAGLCTDGVTQPMANLDDPLKSAYLGQYTFQANRHFSAMNVTALPRYMIEKLTTAPTSPPGAAPVGTAWYNFRISAKGYGVNQGTTVVLQTIFQAAM